MGQEQVQSGGEEITPEEAREVITRVYSEAGKTPTDEDVQMVMGVYRREMDILRDKPEITASEDVVANIARERLEATSLKTKGLVEDAQGLVHGVGSRTEAAEILRGQREAA